MKTRSILLASAGLIFGAVIAPSIMTPEVAAKAAKVKPLPVAKPITTKDRELGAKAHPELLAEFGGAYNGPQAAYVERVGKKIALQTGLSTNGNDFTVTLLNSSVNNAFAIPGGYVYVTRQLMGLMNNEAELASVMGHEEGHVAARHAEKRQKNSNLFGILGAIGQVAAGAILGDTGLGQLLQQGLGTGSQLITLKYSRDQETEADDLGISYLQKAGYDPMAASTMLASLAAQTQLDASVSGSARSAPAWASTHPDPQARVARARDIAAKLPVLAGSKRVLNRDPFLAALDGVMYDDDPQQGVVRGRDFIHPVLKMRFSVPQGYTIGNGTSAVTISGQSGQAQFSGAKIPAGGLDDYVRKVFTALGGNSSNISIGNIQRGQINGMTTATSTARANTQSGQVDVTVVAYDFGGGQAYHFLLLSAAGQGVGPFQSMIQSFAKISAAEAATIKARKVRVVTVKRGETTATFASRMAYDDRQLERFLVLNALPANAVLSTGQKVKIVTY